MKALITEPSEAYRRLYKALLMGAGFEIVEAVDSADTRSICDQTGFDLICMSLLVGGSECYDLVAMIRAGQFNRSTPVLMMTSSYHRDLAERAFATGVTEIFRKEDLAAFEHYVKQFAHHFKPGTQASGRVLYVEENPELAALTRSVLEAAGHQVDHFAKAEEALAAFDKSSYDLVLADMLVEGEMRGTAVIRSIREHPDLDKSRLPFIAMSAFGDNARRIELYRLGANDYVQKPILEEELLVRVNGLVNTRKLMQQLEIQNRQMRDLAMIDQLTGLSNRHYLMAEIPRRISQALRHGYPLSIVVVDIDHFKTINDTHGHSVGDEILESVGTLLKSLSRLEDIVGRYGGEEFVLLLDHCDLDHATLKAETLRRALMELNPQGITVTASFGVAVIDDESREFTDLFQRADKALYRAKENGRNCVQIQ